MKTAVRSIGIFRAIYHPMRQIKHIIIESVSQIMLFVQKAILNILPIKNNKIVVCSNCGQGYCDNGKYIVEEIIQQGLQYDIVWMVLDEVVKNGATFPQQIRTVPYGTLKDLYEMATARIWIDNCRKAVYPAKKKGQYYIQTWHGAMGLKKTEKDAEDKLSQVYLERGKNDSKMADLFLSNSTWRSDIFKKSFWYDGEILESGSPRNDVILTQTIQIQNKVREHFKLNIDKRIVLYAPTFRDNSDIDIYNLNYDLCRNTLKAKFGNDWVILIRLHPNMRHMAEHMRYDDASYDATSYTDMQELLCAADVLITDYSSSMFDFALKRSPCFLFIPDLDQYLAERGLRFELDEIPFRVARNNEELIHIINSFEKDSYTQKVNNFYEKYGVKEDGKASSRVVERIKYIIDSGKKS
ncbi:MAG: CDP-glycerol glycerophosphotransferase family protein [Armatimonadota bacterium]